MILGWLIALTLVAIATFFLLGPQRVWQMTVGDPDTGAMSVDNITRTGKPNDALMVPAWARDRPDSTPIPAFAVDADTLYTTLVARLEALGTVTWAEQDATARYARGITFSPGLKFPDINHIWAVEGEDGTSGLFLYAAAQMGTSDQGKNRERLQGWLALLDDLPRAQTP